MTILDNNQAATSAATSETTFFGTGRDQQVWLADEPTTTIGALLHTEVGHQGACYTDRALWAAGVSVPLGAAAAVTYTVATHLRDGGDLTRALSHWAQVSPTTAVVALLVSALLCIAAAFGDHALWHRDEAPWAGNVVHPLQDEQP